MGSKGGEGYRGGRQNRRGTCEVHALAHSALLGLTGKQLAELGAGGLDRGLREVELGKAEELDAVWCQNAAW